MGGCLEASVSPEAKGPRSAGPHWTDPGMPPAWEGWPALEAPGVDGWVLGLAAGYWSSVWAWHTAVTLEG